MPASPSAVVGLPVLRNAVARQLRSPGHRKDVCDGCPTRPLLRTAKPDHWECRWRSALRAVSGMCSTCGYYTHARDPTAPRTSPSPVPHRSLVARTMTWSTERPGGCRRNRGTSITPDALRSRATSQDPAASWLEANPQEDGRSRASSQHKPAQPRAELYVRVIARNTLGESPSRRACKPRPHGTNGRRPGSRQPATLVNGSRRARVE